MSGDSGNINVTEQALYGAESAQALIDGIRLATSDLINDAINYFKPMRDVYDEYTDIQDRKIPRLDHRLTGLLTGGIICLIVGIAARLIIGALAGWDVIEGIMAKVPVNTIANICVLLILLGVVLIIAKIVYEIVRILLLRSYDKRLDELEDEMDDFYEKSDFVNIIGVEYTDPEILKTLLGHVLSGRATFLSEAINAYVFDKKTGADEE